MGLDMYAYRTSDALPKPVDFDPQDLTVIQEIAYWRKHPNLHGWMEALYREKGGSAEDFNCVPVELTAEDIDKLEAAVTFSALPHTTGFFFGVSQPEDRELDLKFIEDARAAFAEGDRVYYHSWW